jgi:hypothetical protein
MPHDADDMLSPMKDFKTILAPPTDLPPTDPLSDAAHNRLFAISKRLRNMVAQFGRLDFFVRLLGIRLIWIAFV